MQDWQIPGHSRNLRKVQRNARTNKNLLILHRRTGGSAYYKLCLMKPKPNRILAAIIVAPLTVPVLIIFISIALAGFSTFPEVGGVALLSIPISYIGFLVLGLPSFIALQRVGRVTIWMLLITGAVWGVITMHSFITYMFGVSSWQYATLGNTLQLALSGAGLGLCVSATFCFIAGITRRSTRTRATTARAG
jgi:hypothetical protein